MPAADAVVARSLTRRFGRRLALDGIDLTVQRGELFAVVGADGAAKTTLLQSVCAILDPSAGTVTVDGLDSVAGGKDRRKEAGEQSWIDSDKWRSHERDPGACGVARLQVRFVSRRITSPDPAAFALHQVAGIGTREDQGP